METQHKRHLYPHYSLHWGKTHYWLMQRLGLQQDQIYDGDYRSSGEGLFWTCVVSFWNQRKNWLQLSRQRSHFFVCSQIKWHLLLNDEVLYNTQLKQTRLKTRFVLALCSGTTDRLMNDGTASVSFTPLHPARSKTAGVHKDRSSFPLQTQPNKVNNKWKIKQFEYFIWALSL